MSDFMKVPCIHCPYRNDVKPFLTAERGEELAYHATNPYNFFPCHKTTEAEEDDEGETEMLVTSDSKTCAGFLTLQAIECGEDCLPKGFLPSYALVYSESYDMASAYEEAGN